MKTPKISPHGAGVAPVEQAPYDGRPVPGVAAPLQSLIQGPGVQVHSVVQVGRLVPDLKQTRPSYIQIWMALELGGFDD